MKLLFDTHILVWASHRTTNASLPAAAADLIDDQGNELYFSAASIWEVAIKHAQGRLDFPNDPSVMRRALLDHDWVELPITGDHAAAVARLPPIHKDPFDRILVAQAMVEGLTLLTADKTMADYGGPVRLI